MAYVAMNAVLSDSRIELEEAAAELDRTKSIMSFYFLAAVFVGVFITVRRQI